MSRPAPTQLSSSLAWGSQPPLTPAPILTLLPLCLAAHDDGRLELLLSLSGVLPVPVRGTVYNCPVALWLPLDFPGSPPIVLVLPTATLKIRVGPSVDPAGRVTGGYIDGWQRKAEVSQSWIQRLAELGRATWGLEGPSRELG